ncbi:hypothetical protein BJY00DRAFT_270855 [Aspergillus carlsbadensis]|nr:hypothetical protein BJY00DRAFT_270855 [Aspergillus carlsbadensis]
MAPFAKLPLEILEKVCGHLADDHFPSLCNSALASKRWYVAANKQRYRHIHLNVVGRNTLKRDIEKWNSILKNVSGFVSVRSLTIRGSLPTTPSDIEDLTLDYETLDTGPADELTNPYSCYSDILNDLFDFKVKRETDFDGWPALAELLGQMTGLDELTWACDVQLPECLLQTLHTKLPRCKLHIMAFKMPSLHQRAGSPHEIDERDFALATSPSISSILVPISHYDTDGCVEYNEEAVMQLASGLTPNLTHLYLIYGMLGADPSFFEAVRRGRPPWRGFHMNKQQESMQPALQSIYLHSWGLTPASIEYFERWEKYIDFSALRVLQLRQLTSTVLFSAEKYRFNSLKSLALDLAYEDFDQDEPEDNQGLSLDKAASNFLMGISPLESIHLSGLRGAGQTFQTLLYLHGSSIRKLSLASPDTWTEYETTVDQIERIHAHCPRVRDLRIPMKYDGGEPHENMIYQSLGSFRCLTDVSVVLQIEDLPAKYSGSGVSRLRDKVFRLRNEKNLAHDILIAIVRAGASSLQRVYVGIEQKTAPRELQEHAEFIPRNWYALRMEGTSEEVVKAISHVTYQKN